MLLDIGVAVKCKMAAINRKYMKKMSYISACVKDSNDFSTATTYTESGYTMGLVGNASNIQVYWEFKMAANYRTSLENSTYLCSYT